MTHILLNIKYKQLNNILTDEKKGEAIIREWCNVNHHTLVRNPIMHVFPSTYISKKNKNDDWDINKYQDNSIFSNFSYLDRYSNDEIKTYNYNGYTGIGILKESHISIHTYPEENSMHVDFFSCRNLDQRMNNEFIEKYFQKSKTSSFDVTFINRII